MKTILITGGAGYIGSIAVKELLDKNYNVIIVDNLSNGRKELIDNRARFYEVDLIDRENLEEVFRENSIDIVIHFAGYKAPGESMENPEKYSHNVTGTINLLNLMAKYKAPKIIYSSSAAVYASSDEEITEQSKVKPSNYYGVTKLICENLIKWYAKINNFNYVILRYFNVAGDGGLNYVDPNAQNVIPIIMETVMGKRDKFIVCGDDYKTRDGTGVRDYIHVNDLVDAHISALNLDTSEIINLGTKTGVSVKELIDVTNRITGKNLVYEIGERRKGDSDTFVASNRKAKEVLGWEPKRTIDEMIESTYRAYCKNI